MTAGIRTLNHAVFTIKSTGTISTGNITAKTCLNLADPVLTINVEHNINRRLAAFISMNIDGRLPILIHGVAELDNIITWLRRIDHIALFIFIKFRNRHMDHIIHNGRNLNMVECLFSSRVSLTPHEVMSDKAHGLILQCDKILCTIFR